jgi:hypothetical protein
LELTKERSEKASEKISATFIYLTNELIRFKAKDKASDFHTIFISSSDILTSTDIAAGSFCRAGKIMEKYLCFLITNGMRRKFEQLI